MVEESLKRWRDRTDHDECIHPNLIPIDEMKMTLHVDLSAAMGASFTWLLSFPPEFSDLRAKSPFYPVKDSTGHRDRAVIETLRETEGSHVPLRVRRLPSSESVPRPEPWENCSILHWNHDPILEQYQLNLTENCWVIARGILSVTLTRYLRGSCRDYPREEPKCSRMAETQSRSLYNAAV